MAFICADHPVSTCGLGSLPNRLHIPAMISIVKRILPSCCLAAVLCSSPVVFAQEARADAVHFAITADKLVALLEKAGDNAAEISKALELAPADQRDGLLYLIQHMPLGDLQNLNHQFPAGKPEVGLPRARNLPVGEIRAAGYLFQRRSALCLAG